MAAVSRWAVRLLGRSRTKEPIEPVPHVPSAVDGVRSKRRDAGVLRQVQAQGAAAAVSKAHRVGGENVRGRGFMSGAAACDGVRAEEGNDRRVGGVLRTLWPVQRPYPGPNGHAPVRGHGGGRFTFPTPPESAVRLSSPRAHHVNPQHTHITTHPTYSKLTSPSASALTPTIHPFGQSGGVRQLVMNAWHGARTRRHPE